jgi:hypothetical protein
MKITGDNFLIKLPFWENFLFLLKMGGNLLA